MQDTTRKQPAAARRIGANLAAVLLVLAGGARFAHAGAVYKCLGAAGEVAYQDEPCAPAQHESVVAIDPAPAWQPSPEYAVERRRDSQRESVATRSRRRTSEPASYECRAADGQVFYRHSGCPHSVAAQAPSASARHGAARSGGAGSVPVSAMRVSREAACREIGRAGAIGRSGHAYDEITPTYDRNLGHDPCG